MGGPVGSVLGTVGSIAMGTNPFAAVGSTLASNAILGGMGGGDSGPNVGGGTTPLYAQPDFNYGANTYTVGGKPFDASNYFITGDKGVYNLLPLLTNPYQGRQEANTASYNTYQTIYDKMAGDAAAQAAFNKLYAPQTFNYTPLTNFNTLKKDHDKGGFGSGNTLNLNNPTGENNNRLNYLANQANDYIGTGYNRQKFFGNDYMSKMANYDLFHAGPNDYMMSQNPIYKYNKALLPEGLRGDARNDLFSAIQKQLRQSMNYYNPKTGTAPTTPYNYSPIQYVNYNMTPTLSALAQYAAKNKNPFFVPFAPKPVTTTPNAPVNPVGSLANPGQYQPVNVRQGGIIGLLRN